MPAPGPPPSASEVRAGGSGSGGSGSDASGPGRAMEGAELAAGGASRRHTRRRALPKKLSLQNGVRPCWMVGALWVEEEGVGCVRRHG